jgi:hypothetical protein
MYTSEQKSRVVGLIGVISVLPHGSADANNKEDVSKFICVPASRGGARKSYSPLMAGVRISPA